MPRTSKASRAKRVPMFARKTGAPLYLQIMEHFLSRIESGEWAEGAMIPTEAELCREYGVSKITVREAIKILVKAGKLHRTPGKGTFVEKPKLEQKLNRFFSFTRWARQHGLNPASRLLRVETQEADKHIARHLGVAARAPVTRIERLRLGNEEPLMFETIWVSGTLCPNLHLQDLSNVPLNDIIVSAYKVPLVRATEAIEPSQAPEHIARLLGVEPGSLLLMVEHTAFTRDARIVYFVTSYYRGDRVRFTIELTASS
jgi:GntR family transcriptional regulator